MNPKFVLTFLQSLPSMVLEESLTDNSNLTLRHQTQPLVAMKGLPLQAPNLNAAGLGSWLFIATAGVVGIIILLTIGLWSYKLVYNITPNNEAFVRTGGLFVKKKTVIINGGCVVLPGFHELTRVPLREISIDVERTGALAVRTQDYLRANMRVTFYVCINADEQDVSTAAARLSKKGRISEIDIKDALEKRADDAIRAAAKRKSLAEIDSDKLGFADEVLNLIQQDLKKVGLTLNNIAISEIEESDTYDENNFFDAQGVRLRTETIQRSIQQKKEVELTTKVTIEQQELDAEKQSLSIAQQKEEAQLSQEKAIAALQLTQQQEIEALKAQREREVQEAKDQEAAKIQRNKLLQDKAVEEENIRQQLAVQQSQIESDIALEEENKKLKVARAVQQQEAEVAEISRQIAIEEENKKLKIARATQQQEAEVAEISRQQTVDASRLRAKIEVASAEQESQIAQQEAAIAIADKEKERLATEAERMQAEVAVQTAKQVEEAERERNLSVIEAEKEAQKKQISDNNVVEIEVFRRRRQAEIARQAAELEAESIRTLAEANKYKDLSEAEGKKALIEAENALSNANRTAEVIKLIFPEIADQLPELAKALAPQPGVLGDARIYAFPGANGNGNGKGDMNDINKLLLSTSGLSLINSLLDEGKLGNLITQVKELLNSEESTEEKSTSTSAAVTVQSKDI
ncbi:MAG: SPFH domain-containing protein [Cyanobacteria bacterium P01_E01_bin.42]